ncbi:AI-2E family transporter [Patescibacteria group bacterium]|nr:AI-2E family transporter [Patescibacteria group bacterium]
MSARPSPSYELSFRSIFKVVAVALGMVMFWLIRDVLLYCFLAILLAGVIYPFANLGARYHIPKIVSVLCLYFMIFGGLGLMIALLVPALIEQSQAFLSAYGSQLGGLGDVLKMANAFGDAGGTAGTSVTSLSGFQSQIQTLFSTGLSTLTGFFGGLAGFIVVLVLGMYIVIEDTAIKRVFNDWIPKEYQEFATRLTWLIMEKLGGWMRGQLLLCLIIGTMYLVAFESLQLPYALLLAFLGGILEFVPFIGPILAAIPAVFLAFTISPTIALLTLIVQIIIQQLENHVIVPKIMQRALGLNPIVSILAFLVGANLFGVVGAIIAIPVVIAVSVILTEWRRLPRNTTN